VPAEIGPPALAQLVDFAERPRTEGWSLRAALVRYAQPQPQRVEDLLGLVRRVERALGQHAHEIERRGPEHWEALGGRTPASSEVAARVVGVLSAARELDQRRIGPAVIKERARIAGAQLVVESSPGVGTRIELAFAEEMEHV